MEWLKERIRDRAEALGVALRDNEREAVLRDILRWLRRERPPEEIVKTEDGSVTLWSHEFGEPYHSLSAGAVRECVEKFITPSRVEEFAGREGRVKVLEVGFGIGYNVALLVFTLRRLNPGVYIEVVSLERQFPEQIPLLPEPYRDLHRMVLNLLPSGEREGLNLKVLLGDARERIDEVAGFGADAVFHDPFSPYRNPDMWSLDFLRKVKLTLKEEGFWVSYTSSLPVRKALRELGFSLGSTRPVGRRRGGTVASLRGEVEPLSAEEERKINTSPYSVPFRDRSLKEKPLNILIDYRLSVLLRERELFSGGRRELQRSRS